VTQYGIYRDGATSPSATVNGTTFTFTDLNVANGSHTYSVDAADASGHRSAKTPVVTVIIGDAIAPTVPANLTATLNGANAQLAWSASTDGSGVTGYGVYRNNVKVNDVTGAPPATSFTDPSLAPGTYAYRIDAVDAAGNRSAQSVTATVTIAGLPVATAPVQSLSATTLGATSANVTLNWSGTGSIHHFQLQRSTNGGAFADVTLPTPTSTSVALALTLNTSFQFRVRAVNGSGGAGSFGTGPSFTTATNDNNSTAITYTASWATTTLTGAFGGSVRATSTASARATFTLTTTTTNGAIAWVSSRGPDRGIATISIDGGSAVNVNLFATTAQRSAVVFRSSALSAGTHTVRVTALGTKDARSSGRRVDVDAFLSLR
jgi:large repetitive protein